jgi:ACT domain-containing protein
MAVTVKKAVLWRKEIDNRPGMLATALQPLSEAGANLQVDRNRGSGVGQWTLHKPAN